MSKKKWKRIIKIVLVILAILLIIALIDFIRKKTSKHDKIEDFVNLKELVEYIGCDYYKVTSSTEEGYEGDYYIRFSVDPIDESIPQTNQKKYENIILSIEEFLKYKNIRIIDESRKLVVRTNCNAEQKDVRYTINGNTGYFERMLAKIQVEQNKEKISNFNIVSPELNSIINVNWVRRNASLGTIEKNHNTYDVYENEGYITRTIGTKIANIVFNKKYDKEVISGIKPGMPISEVVATLGDPTYKELADVNSCGYVGYKLASCYVFFSDVISVYPIMEFDEEKNNQFAEAVSKFEQDGLKSEFLKKVTEIYPNHSRLTTATEENNNSSIVEYPLYGFSIILSDDYSRMIIYSNYQGKIDKDITIDEIKLGLKSLPFIETELHKNSVEYEEGERVEASK